MTDLGQLHGLAIFPLPDVVLFPGSSLPLRVFEPRYRDLTADALAGSRQLAMVRLVPGYEPDYSGRPSVFEVATVCEIVSADRLDDGRYTMIVRGTDRIRICRELPPERSYRQVDADVLDGRRLHDLSSATAAVNSLVAVSEQLAVVASRGGDELRALVHSTQDPALLADRVAGALVRSPDDRQALLENLDPESRLDALVGQVASMVARFTPRSSMPN